MSLLSPNKDDEAFAAGHAEAGLRMRMAEAEALERELDGEGDG